MTTMFRNYAGVSTVVTDELWADMSGSAKAIYVILCRLSHRCSNLQVKVDDGDLSKRAGIVERTLFGARKELIAKGLITYKRHTYDLLEESTGTKEEQTPKAAPCELIMRVEGVDLSDDDFPYVANLLIPAGQQPAPQQTQQVNELDLKSVW